MTRTGIRIIVTAFMVALACYVVLPPAALANEDLEVTMEVLDDLSEVKDSARVGRQPSEIGNAGDPVDPETGESEDLSSEDRAGRESDRNEFEHDDIDEDDRQRSLEIEYDFEEGEEVDYDEFD